MEISCFSFIILKNKLLNFIYLQISFYAKQRDSKELMTPFLQNFKKWNVT